MIAKSLKYVIPTVLIGLLIMNISKVFVNVVGVDDSAAENRIIETINNKNIEYNRIEEEIKQEKYMKENYTKYTASEIENKAKINIDIDHDGKDDMVKFQAQEYDGPTRKETSCSIMIDYNNNDKEPTIMSETYYGTFVSAYLLESETDKKYILAEIKYNDNNSTIASFSLDDELSLLCDGTFYGKDINSDYGFKIFKNSNLLGCNTIYKQFRFVNVGAGIVPIDNKFSYLKDDNNQTILTTKIELPVFVYTSEDEMIAKKLETGTKLELIETDNESIIWAKSENGDLCQINTTKTNGMYSIDNIQAKYYFHETSDN